MQITLLPDEENELEEGWNVWGDQSYVVHAGYILRRAVEREYPTFGKNDED